LVLKIGGTEVVVIVVGTLLIYMVPFSQSFPTPELELFAIQPEVAPVRASKRYLQIALFVDSIRIQNDIVRNPVRLCNCKHCVLDVVVPEVFVNRMVPSALYEPPLGKLAVIPDVPAIDVRVVPDPG
jgi:hypothetical protein